MKTSSATFREGLLRHQRPGRSVCDSRLCADFFEHLLLEHEVLVRALELDELRATLRTT